MVRQYETTFLIDSHLPNEQIEACISKYTQLIEKNGGKIKLVERWGKRRMAYAIGKAHEAYYVFFHYEGGPEIPAELARRFRQMDTIIRHLTLAKETQMNVRKKKKVKKNAGTPAEPEAAAAAEPKREEA